VPGLPVVYGNVYVGRVAGVDPEEREVRIDLVTGPRFAVGARLSDASPPIWMTVGGVFAGRNRRSRTVERLALVARNPSDREAPEGRVEVGELLPDIDPWAHLAEGFELGTLVRVPRSDERVVLAEIDYGAGLYHVHVLCPEGSRAGARSELELAISDLDWRPTRRLAAGDPSSWRGATKIAAGRSAGVEPGAAVISGLRLVGRVERAGEWSSDVRLLGDPGLRLVAVARVAGESRPRVLGRLVSLGPDPSGAWIRFRWEAVVGVELPLQGSGSAAAEATVEARLFSGAGDSGLPVGLFLGEARLSTAVDPSVGAPVVLLRHDDRLGPGNLWVRTARERRP
jgi:hypothetical protein